MWDTTIFTIPIEDSKLHHLVHWENKDNMLFLKVARFMFDECYPNGPDDILAVKKKPHKMQNLGSKTAS